MKAPALPGEHKVSVVVASDDSRFVEGLQSRLEGDQSLEVAACDRTGRSAAARTEELGADVLLLDLDLDLADRIAAGRHIGERSPTARIVAVVSETSTDDIADARDAGAVAFVSKEAADGGPGFLALVASVVTAFATSDASDAALGAPADGERGQPMLPGV